MMVMVMVVTFEQKNVTKWQGERARVMQMKNQRFLYPESAAERRQAEDDPLVRDHVDVDDYDASEDEDGDDLGQGHEEGLRRPLTLNLNNNKKHLNPSKISMTGKCINDGNFEMSLHL